MTGRMLVALIQVYFMKQRDNNEHTKQINIDKMKISQTKAKGLIKDLSACVLQSMSRGDW